MDKKLKILHLEDSSSDAMLIGRALQKGKIDFERLIIETKTDFINALKDFSPDVILSDHSLPSFNSHDALEIFHKTGMKIPFILITANVSEEFAVDIIKRGADDYILKDRLSRLPNAIKNILEKFSLEKEKEIFLEGIIKNEKYYRALIENIHDAIILIDKNTHVIYQSPSAERISGFGFKELENKKIFEYFHPDDLQNCIAFYERAYKEPGISLSNQYRILHKKGYFFWVEGTITNLLHDESVNAFIVNYRDISERKKAEEKLMHANRLYAFISDINQTIVHSLDQHTVFKEACSIAIEVGKFKAAWIGIIDTDNRKINLVEGAGIPPEDLSKFTNLPYADNGPLSHVLRTGTYYLCNNISDDLVLEEWKPLAAERGYGSCIVLPLKKSGHIIATFNLYANEPDFFTTKEIALLEEATDDISFSIDVFEKQKEKLNADELLKHKEERLNHAQSIAHLGSWELNFSTGISQWSDEQLRIYGLPISENVQSYESWVSFIHPEDLEYVLKITAEAKISLNNTAFFFRIVRKDGSVRHIYSQSQVEFDDTKKPVGLYGVTHDVTEMKEAEKALKESESNLQAIFENTSDGFILADRNGFIKSFNNKSRDIIRLNIEKEIKVGSSIFDFIHESRKDIYKDTILQVLAGETKQYEYLYERKNGEIKWYCFTINPVYYSGKIDGFSITSLDITGRKKDEEKIIDASNELQKAVTDLNKIMDSSLDVICTMDEEGKFVTVSAASQAIWGYTPAELLGTKYMDLVFEDDVEETVKAAEKIANGIQISLFRNRYVHKSGRVVPLLWSVNWDDTNKLLFCVAKDVTEMEKAEEALRTSESNLQAIFENTSEGFILTDLTGIVKSYNNTAREIFFLNSGKEFTIGESILDFVRESKKEMYRATIPKVLAGENLQYDICFDRKNGETKWFNFAINRVCNNEKTEGFIITASDITEQKKTEEQKEFNRNNLAALINNTHDLMWSIDKNYKLITFNQPFFQIIRMASGKKLVEGDDIFSVVESREQEDRFRISYARALAGETFTEIEKMQGFVESWSEISYYPIMKGDKVVGTACHSRDITERKKAEENLRQSEKRYRRIIETAQEGIWVIDVNNKTTFVNDKMCEIIEYQCEEMLGRTNLSFKDAEDQKIALQQIDRRKEGIKETHESRFITKSGRQIWTQVSTSPVFNDEGIYSGALAMVTDITDRKLADIRLLELHESIKKQSKKLAVSNAELERYAYVTSHDLQEPLRMVTSFVQLLQKKYDGQLDDTAQKYINFAVDGAARMKTLILDLLEFSRISSFVEDHTTINLNDVITKTRLALKTVIDESGALINVDFLPKICGNESQLLQLFQNLISNAIKYKGDASPVIDISFTETEDEWEFCVRDNGIGIDEKFFEKIFIIFQRLHNRKEYDGTGIGLAICKKIVELHGGRIWVESTKGEGSKFCFTILKLQTSEENDSEVLCPDIDNTENI